MIKIFTDTTAYIPGNLAQQYDITTVPIKIKVDGEDFYENQLPSKLFYQLMERDNVEFVVAPPSLDVVTEMFEKEVKAGNRILGIFISSKLGEVFSVFQKAKESILKHTPDAKIHIIDSQTHSMELGLAVLAAAEKNAEGAWLENVAEAAYKVMQRTRYMFTPSNLKYLGKIGTIEKGQALVGDLINIRPVLSLVKGEVVPLETKFSNRKALDRMIDIMNEDAKEYGVTHIVISHINADEKAEQLKKRMEKNTDVNIIISDIGASIGYYMGPGTVGLIYQTEIEHPVNEHIKIPHSIV